MLRRSSSNWPAVRSTRPRKWPVPATASCARTRARAVGGPASTWTLLAGYGHVFAGAVLEDEGEDDELLAARFDVPPWLALRSYRFPVNAFATRLRRARADEVLSPPAPEPEHVALDRRDFVVRRTPLDRGRFELLQDLRAGHALTDALTDALARLSSSTLLSDETTPVAWFDAFARAGWLRPRRP